MTHRNYKDVETIVGNCVPVPQGLSLDRATALSRTVGSSLWRPVTWGCSAGGPHEVGVF